MTAGDVEVAGLSALTERLYSSNPGCLCRKNAPNSKVSRNANPNIRNRVWLCSKIFDDRIAAGPVRKSTTSSWAVPSAAMAAEKQATRVHRRNAEQPSSLKK